MNTLHWFDSLLPALPHFGCVLVFIVVFVNNVGLPLPGETILLGAGFVLGRSAGSLWEPMLAGTAADFLGGICAFALGRRLGNGDLEKVHWLHLSARRLAWPQRFFERHGAKTVFIARFVVLCPPIAANLCAGMTRIPWRTFLLLNLAGSAGHSVGYIMLGYFFGKKWRLLPAWTSSMTLYAILAGIILLALGVIFRRPLSRLLASR